ncbi:MAG: S1 RNA-binding domain-containing protein [archaeon]
MYQKKGFPEKEEFVVCTVKTILPSSVVVELDEFENKEGMVHISEIARKWIRNIKTYMKVGTKLVCKVMEVRPDENLITLSVRRVGAAQHRNKLAEWNDEKKANDILEVFAKQNNMTSKVVYEKVGNKILETNKILYPTFAKLAREGEKVLTDLKIEKDVSKSLTELIQKRIVLPKAEIYGILTMCSAASNGIEVIKEAASKSAEIAKAKKVVFELKYLGAPNYKFRITAPDFKVAEDTFKEICMSVTKIVESAEGSAEFKRDI